jgi:mono/diheme cytochrome c family protein
MTSLNASVLVVSSALAVLIAGPVGAAGQEGQGTIARPATAASALSQPGEREVIPGADNMTSAEREAYRRRMAAAATPDEKAKVRAEYANANKVPVPATALVGDPVRGATLHKGCFGCHGIEQYTAPLTYAAASFIDSVLRASGLSDLPPAEPTRFKGRVGSLAALREGVTRRNDYLNPKMTPQEVEDVVAYLNATYYKFPR